MQEHLPVMIAIVTLAGEEEENMCFDLESKILLVRFSSLSASAKEQAAISGLPCPCFPLKAMLIPLH